MSEKPSKVLVTGATGAQGGAVARSLLERGIAVRCLSRTGSSANARLLASLGVEVVPGDLSDLASLIAATTGCDAVFGVTDFWEHFGSEVAHGRNLVDAARARGVRHLVLSTLPSSTALSQGELLVPHMETKQEIERYARSSGQPCTFVHVAFYFENFLNHFPPKPSVDGGHYAFGFPQGDTALAGIGIADLGPVVASILLQPRRFLGAVVGAAADERPCSEYAAIMSRTLQRDIRYSHISANTYAELGFSGAAELAAMFELNRRFIASRSADIARTRELHPDANDFEAWLRTHRARFEQLFSKTSTFEGRA